VTKIEHIPTPRSASPIEASDVPECTPVLITIEAVPHPAPACVVEDTIPRQPSHNSSLTVNLIPIEAKPLASVKAFSESTGLDDLESEVSPPSSVLSISGREDLISHAELIRQTALEADQRCVQLGDKRQRALEDGRIKEAFLLKFDIQNAETASKRLHKRAERRYYRGA
jgi:hypothetical protein